MATTTLSTDAPAMSLAEKTESVAFGWPDTPPSIEALWETCKQIPENDHGDWGLTLGIAIGIARSENPFESIESVVNRALPAAAYAFGEYTGGRVVLKAEVAS